MEVAMATLLRALRLLVVVASTITAATLPACGSMGMKYMIDPAPAMSALPDI
jgi:hypothetical protein